MRTGNEISHLPPCTLHAIRTPDDSRVRNVVRLLEKCAPGKEAIKKLDDSMRPK